MMGKIGRAAGRTYTPQQIRALFRRADKDRNKQLDFHEFVHMQVREDRGLLRLPRTPSTPPLLPFLPYASALADSTFTSLCTRS